MLTPKEKAIELLDKYSFLKEIFSPSINEQKICALITVDELISEFIQLSIEASGTLHLDFGHVYYQQVKQEIEKL
jgi:hypothetical protein